MNRRIAALRTARPLRRARSLSPERARAKPRRRPRSRTASPPWKDLSQPEALSFDPAQNVYFVSNINGSPGVKDGNGFISRITADGVMDSLHFIQGGRNGVQLDAPMGSRVQGDTLWVLDVDKLRGFNTHTGAPTHHRRSRAFEGALSQRPRDRFDRRVLHHGYRRRRWRRTARTITPAPIASSTSRTIAP